MKCPKCGFVSFAGLEQCKKCGYPFVKAAPKVSASPQTSMLPEAVPATPSDAPELPAERKESTQRAARELPPQIQKRDEPAAVPVAAAPPKLPPPVLFPEREHAAPPVLTDSASGRRRNPRRDGPELSAEQPGVPVESIPLRVAAAQESISDSNRPRPSEPPTAWIKELAEGVENYRTGAGPSRRDGQPPDWREELSERLDNFRKRRARLQPDADPLGNLELDFESSENHEFNRFMYGALDTPNNEDSNFDLEIGEPVVTHDQEEEPLHDTLILEPSNDDLHDEKLPLDSVPFEGEDEISLGEHEPDHPPMEILVDSPPMNPMEDGEEAEGIYLATLGRRFLAGLTDALVLIVGAALFGVIFWRFCGHLSLVPLNIAVLGLVAGILIFAYFAIFTAIASATPGLLWLGCEIRNLQGEHPSPSESCWRAFGILVSLSAFMLGFLWACIDSGGMTWHDRMSGTVVTEGSSATGLADVTAEI